MSERIERAAARPETACAQSCPESCSRAIELAQLLLARATARARHERIILAEDLVRLFTPAVVMASVLAMTAPKAAVAASAAFVIAQHGAAAMLRVLRPRLPETIDGALDALPLALGTVAAIATCLVQGALAEGYMLWPTAVAGLGLMFWPGAFHRWRGARLTDFERMDALEVGCGCPCA